MGVSAGSTISELLRCSRFDVLPLDAIEDEVREHLATDIKVTVAASPRKGLEATLELSERLAAAGYPVVPHLFTFNEVGSTERWRRRTLSRLTHR